MYDYEESEFEESCYDLESKLSATTYDVFIEACVDEALRPMNPTDVELDKVKTSILGPGGSQRWADAVPLLKILRQSEGN